MKRIIGVFAAILLAALLTPPALAQSPRRNDRVCTGGSLVVSQTDMPQSVILFNCGVRIQSGAVVGKDVVSFSGDVVVEPGAHITGDLVVFGANADVGGQIGHRMTVFGGNALLRETAVVQENVEMIGGYLDRQDGSVVRGQIRGDQFTSPYVGAFGVPFAMGGGLLGAFLGLVIGFVRGLIWAVSLAVLGALVVVFMPQQTKQVGDTALSSAMPSLGVGCVTILAAFCVGLFLMITLCGIPLGILLFVALAAAWIFGWIALGLLAGQRILQALNVKEILPIVAVVVGVIVITVLGLVPFIGWLVSLFLVLLGIGSVVLTRFGTRPYPPPAPTVAPSAPAAPALPAPPAAPSGGQTAS